MRARDLLDPGDGLVQHGDELHDPANWSDCPACGATGPADSETCFNCGAAKGGEDR